MKRFRTGLQWLALCIPPAMMLFGALTGWFGRPQAWQETSGANTLQMPSAVETGFGLQWLGHSGFLVKADNVRFALDPNLSQSCSPVPRLTRVPDLPPRISLDAVLISHAHYDHFDVETLHKRINAEHIILPKGTDRFLPEELRRTVQIHGMTAGDTIQLRSVRITAVAAAHQGGRNHPLKSRFEALGYVVTTGDHTLYYSGDTSVDCDFEAIAAVHHPETVILPIGAFAPRFPLKYHHLSPEEAVTAAKRLGATTVIPCHFGTFRLAFDAPDTALPSFAAAAESAGLTWFVPDAPLPYGMERKREDPVSFQGLSHASGSQ